MKQWSVLAWGLVVFVFLAAVLSGGSNTARESAARLGYKPREVLVKFREDTPTDSRSSLRAEVSGSRIHTFTSGAEHWRLDGSADTLDAIAFLKDNYWVEYIEPNYTIQLLSTTPDDPNFAQQWALKNTGQSFIPGQQGGTSDADIDADLAWDVTQGDPNARVVVAVIDSGVDTSHPDLAANIWNNPGEAGGLQGTDDDGNQRIDDLHGWDFSDPNFPFGTAHWDPNCPTTPPPPDPDPNDNPDPNGDPNFVYSATPALGHGTHVSGIIGAESDNNTGIAGVVWNVAIMSLKISGCKNADPITNTSNVVNAINYAVAEGAQVINASWGIPSGCPNRPAMCAQTLYNAIKAAQDREVLFVAASGNQAHDIDSNNLAVYSYPSSYDLDGIISVIATDANDHVTGASSWGAVSVDLGAPGGQI